MEQAPNITKEELYETLATLADLPSEMQAAISEANDAYEYWDTVKYKKLPENFSAKDLWRAVVAERTKTNVAVWKKYAIHFGLTNKMQQQCHTFDVLFHGTDEISALHSENRKNYCLTSSQMEEAISSSQMEGAATTRKIAKEMLRKQKMPRDKSQQMIYNNYRTIRFIVANKDKPLSAELLLQTHRLMTDGTLENAGDAGKFRQNDDVVVEDSITHEVVHTPPPADELTQFVEELCTFFNGKSDTYIHPIIKGIIVHFMLAYMHPFVDGNGRTSRALFYWYMLKEGYRLTEFLAISRIIYKSKKSYEKSFLHAETDGNDIGYFITYNLRVLDLAFKDLQQYLKRKTAAQESAATFLRIGGINERQAEIVRIYHENPGEILTVKDLQTRFLVTPTTAKSDISGLLQLGILTEIPLNKVKKGYVKGPQFDNIVGKLKP